LISIQTGPIQVHSWIVPVCENFVLIVDPAGCSLTNDESAITGYLHSHGLLPIAVILTHGHFDHVIGLPVIKKEYPKIKIAVHEKDACFIGSDSGVYQKRCLDSIGAKEILPFVKNLPAADFLLKDTDSLVSVSPRAYCLTMCNNDVKTVQKIQDALQAWTVIFTPGHTPGSVCYYNADKKQLISGDTVFYQSYGRTDLYGGNEVDMMQSISKIRDLIPSATKVYPGHGYADFLLSETL